MRDRATRVERLQGENPELGVLVEARMRQRRPFREIAAELRERFGVKIAPPSLWRYWKWRFKPREEAEAQAHRQAHAEARAVIQEMKADPSLDATQIAEILLANQILKDRLKLGEVGIMQLYREQRERMALRERIKKTELQLKALELREGKVKAAVREAERPGQRGITPEVMEKIREIYGLRDPEEEARTEVHESGVEGEPAKAME